MYSEKTIKDKKLTYAGGLPYIYIKYIVTFKLNNDFI
jgi:hypothetical protein